MSFFERESSAATFATLNAFDAANRATFFALLCAAIGSGADNAELSEQLGTPASITLYGIPTLHLLRQGAEAIIKRKDLNLSRCLSPDKHVRNQTGLHTCQALFSAFITSILFAAAGVVLTKKPLGILSLDIETQSTMEALLAAGSALEVFQDIFTRIMPEDCGTFCCYGGTMDASLLVKLLGVIISFMVTMVCSVSDGDRSSENPLGNRTIPHCVQWGYYGCYKTEGVQADSVLAGFFGLAAGLYFISAVLFSISAAQKVNCKQQQPLSNNVSSASLVELGVQPQTYGAAEVGANLPPSDTPPTLTRSRESSGQGLRT